MTDRLHNEIEHILANLENKQGNERPEQEPDTTTSPGEVTEIIEETIEVYFIPKARDAARIIDSRAPTQEDPSAYFSEDPQAVQEDEERQKPAAQQQQRTVDTLGYVTVILYLLLVLSCIAFQMNQIINPPTVSITFVSKPQQVTLTSMLQIGRILNPITISQSQATQATGRGHQAARQATGILTFYNGSFSTQTVFAGTVFTGADGVRVVTDETRTIPPNNPPMDGEASTPAHAANPGPIGNIQALDINSTVSSVVFVKNLNAFTGGQDERNFTIVTQADMNTVSTLLKTTLNQDAQGALQGQLQPHEALVTPGCTTSLSSDHPVGAEATQVKITASETCTAVAYNQSTLLAKATSLLTTQATKTLGTDYSPLGTIQITSIKATGRTLTFSCQGTWIYALAERVQQHMKHLIAGKTKEEALKLLFSLPGIESASIQWHGFSDEARIPKDIARIHPLLIIGTG
jgi:hypothetical protein